MNSGLPRYAAVFRRLKFPWRNRRGDKFVGRSPPSSSASATSQRTIQHVPFDLLSAVLDVSHGALAGCSWKRTLNWRGDVSDGPGLARLVRGNQELKSPVRPWFHEQGRDDFEDGCFWWGGFAGLGLRHIIIFFFVIRLLVCSALQACRCCHILLRVGGIMVSGVAFEVFDISERSIGFTRPEDACWISVLEVCR